MINSRTDFIKIRQYVVEKIYTSETHPVQFPSTRKLATLFNVSQPTALRAIKDLIAEGILVACKGGGTMSVPLQSKQPYRVFGILANRGQQAFEDIFFENLNHAVVPQLLRKNSFYCIKNIQLPTPSLLETTCTDSAVSGLILLYAHEHLLNIATRLRNQGMPMISVGIAHPEISSAYYPIYERVCDVLARMFEENRSRILIPVQNQAPIIDEAARAINDTCSRYGQDKTKIKVWVRPPEDESCQELLQNNSFDGVLFLRFDPGLYRSLQLKYDIYEKCRIIIDDIDLRDDMNYVGYVIKYEINDAVAMVLPYLTNGSKEVVHVPFKYKIEFLS